MPNALSQTKMAASAALAGLAVRETIETKPRYEGTGSPVLLLLCGALALLRGVMSRIHEWLESISRLPGFQAESVG